MTSAALRDTTINIRARSDQKAIIDRASRMLGKNRSDFMLELACERAMDLIADQRLVLMDEVALEAFSAALEAQPADNPKLKALMATKAPWDKA